MDKIGGTFKGEIAEVVAYDRVLPNLAREKIEAYLAHKWGLQSLLPTTHKYVIALPTFGGAQEIAFQPMSDKTPVSAPFTVVAESSSGLPVSFESNDTARATVSGNTVTIVNGATPGTVGIKAKQAEYLGIQETGGERLPRGRALVLPSQARVNQYGNIPRKAVARALSRPNAP